MTHLCETHTCVCPALPAPAVDVIAPCLMAAMSVILPGKAATSRGDGVVKHAHQCSEER
jgi:hypothetical protein